MSWLSDIFDVGSEFVGDNASWLKPAAQLGLNLFKQYETNDANSQIADIYRQREQQNYDQYVKEYGAYKDWATQNAAASASASAARAAAAGATDKNKRAAAAKANTTQQKGYDKLIKLLKPINDATSSFIEPSKNTMLKGFDNISLLNQYVMSPERMALLNDSGPAYGMEIPLPDRMLKK